MPGKYRSPSPAGPTARVVLNLPIDVKEALTVYADRQRRSVNQTAAILLRRELTHRGFTFARDAEEENP